MQIYSEMWPDVQGKWPFPVYMQYIFQQFYKKDEIQFFLNINMINAHK